MPALAQQAGPASLDRVLVVVNDEVITESELRRELEMIRRDLSSRNVRPPSDSVLTRQALERLVIDRIQLQYAARAGLDVPEDLIEGALATMADQNRMSPEAFRAAVEREGIDFEDFRRRLADDLAIRQLRERRINPRVVVSEEEIESALATVSAAGGPASEYDVSHILLAVRESASASTIAERRALAEDVAAAIRQGESFESVAARVSDSQEALEGGRLGWRSSAELPDVFLGALKDMEPGQISDVLQSANGFHILRLNDRRGGARPLVTQYRLRQILLRPSDYHDEEEIRQRLQLLRQRVLNGADFVDLARKNSEDSRTRKDGGDLGWVNAGDVDPAVERAIRDLPVGDISLPVDGRAGHYIVQLLDRRRVESDAGLDRELVRQQIFLRKADEMYERWVRELRDQASVQFVDSSSG